MTSDLFFGILVLFGLMFVAGTVACLPLYHWKWQAFAKSSLWLKIRWWVPIFAVFCTILWVGLSAALIVATAVILQGWNEWKHQKAWKIKASYAYLFLFSACMAFLPVIFWQFQPLVAVKTLIIICFASVLSDVTAFFAGSYLGNHPLPGWINTRKSWEGVGGQIVGALFGALCAAILPQIGFHLALALTIGIASTLGDLCNSVVKRKLGITDWAQTIPGHGGVLDRCASLSFALAAGFLVVAII